MAGTQVYIPYCLRSFQGFLVSDIKEFRDRAHMQIILSRNDDDVRICARCGDNLLGCHDKYWVEARHLRVCGWTVSVCFYREKRHCGSCKKVRSEWISFLSPTSPHVTLEMAFWINRLTEITSVLQVSHLESIDKQTCYKIDKYILTRLLQGYQIPPVTHIAVDEVYARGPRQLKDGEDRGDLFLTVVVDLKTRKVIWVSQGRSKESLNDFFAALGSVQAAKIQVVATDQHDPYNASIREHAPQAKVVWDRFHLVQKFNEALNEERHLELERIDPEGGMGDLANNKYKYIFMTRAGNRSSLDKKHIEEVMKQNTKFTQLEIIKERFHQVFDQYDKTSAQEVLCDVYDWAYQAKAFKITKWIMSIIDDERFWNYFEFKVTTGLSEGINRVIKGIKWQAYGYKDMTYFALKILQKAGFLNSKYAMNGI
jgi:transposase